MKTSEDNNDGPPYIEHSQHSRIEKGYDIQQPNLEFSTEVKPTVLWSGDGYHIYLPIRALVLDDFGPFSKEKYPNLFSEYNDKYDEYSVSELFLLFAIRFLTDGKADPQHRPTFNSCLIRIPNTFNSKCLAKGLSLEESMVKIIQEWNGYRLPIQLLTIEFRRRLVQEEINQKIQNRKIRNTYSIKFGDTSNFQIQPIERLLQTGIPDGRKETLRLILGPYLIKRKSYEESKTFFQMAVRGKRKKFNPFLVLHFIGISINEPISVVSPSGPHP